MSYTLSDIIKKDKISIKDYQTLILDTQGSELQILKGPNKLLKNFKYIKLEASNFELYKNNRVLKEIADYLKNYNLIEVKKNND